MEYVLSHIIPEYLNDKDKLQLFATCKWLLSMREKFKYNSAWYNYSDVKDVSYISCIVYIRGDLRDERENIVELTEHQKQHITCFVVSPSSFTITSPDILIRNMPYHVTGLCMACYNGPLTGWLPKTLKVLRLDYTFNHEIYPGDLPDSLVSFTMGGYYDKSLSGILPPNLKKLELKCMHNEPLNNLPDSIEYLEFPGWFNQPLTGNMPKSAKKLSFGSEFKQPISHYLLEGLIRLDLCGMGYQHNIKVPKSLQFLFVNGRTYKGAELIPFRR